MIQPETAKVVQDHLAWVFSLETEMMIIILCHRSAGSLQVSESRYSLQSTHTPPKAETAESGEVDHFFIGWSI